MLSLSAKLFLNEWVRGINYWKEYKALGNPGTIYKINGKDWGKVSSRIFRRVGTASYSSLYKNAHLEEANKRVVKKRNNYLNRLKLGAMVKSRDEPIRNFETKENWNNCQYALDFTDHR